MKLYNPHSPRSPHFLILPLDWVSNTISFQQQTLTAPIYDLPGLFSLSTKRLLFEYINSRGKHGIRLNG